MLAKQADEMRPCCGETEGQKQQSCSQSRFSSLLHSSGFRHGTGKKMADAPCRVSWSISPAPGVEGQSVRGRAVHDAVTAGQELFKKGSGSGNASLKHGNGPQGGYVSDVHERVASDKVLNVRTA
jgi:hypothetical protein